jgi:hypothetical protein
MLWYTCLIKHAETLLRTKDCCTHFTLIDIYVDFPSPSTAKQEYGFKLCYGRILTHPSQHDIYGLQHINLLPSAFLKSTGWSCNITGSVVVKALCYKPKDRGFETRWGELLCFQFSIDPGVYSASDRNAYQKQKNNVFVGSRARPVRRADNLTSICDP